MEANSSNPENESMEVSVSIKRENTNPESHHDTSGVSESKPILEPAKTTHGIYIEIKLEPQDDPEEEHKDYHIESVMIKKEPIDEQDSCNDTSDVRGSRKILESEETNNTMEMNIKLESDDDVPVKQSGGVGDVTSVVNIKPESGDESEDIRSDNTRLNEIDSKQKHSNSLESDTSKPNEKIIISLSPIFTATCDVCHKQFQSKQALQEHVCTTKERPSEIICNVCNFECPSLPLLNSHLRLHDVKRKFVCDICQWRFMNVSHLRMHIRAHTGEKPYQCDVCAKGFTQKGNLISHLRTHTGEKPFKCDVCKKSFSHFINLVRHKRLHNNEEPYKCKVCNKCFSLKRYLVRHMRLHTGAKPYKCNVCEECFMFNSHLKEHLKTHSGESLSKGDDREKGSSHNTDDPSKQKDSLVGENPYKCNFCDACFSTRRSLKEHSFESHPDQMRHKCEICEKSFQRKSHLKVHRKSHGGENAYKCDGCEKCFSQNRHLIRHKRTHLDIKPFVCDVCDRVFLENSHLVKHKRKHSTTVDKSFKCDVCGKTFAQNAHLVGHVRSHTGEKPFQCDLCDRCFSHNSNLLRHKRSHATKKLFKCDFCVNIFTIKREFFRHMKSHANQNV